MTVRFFSLCFRERRRSVDGWGHYRSGSKGEEERLVGGWKSGIALVAVAQQQIRINDMENAIVYKGGTSKSETKYQKVQIIFTSWII